ncbi:hypothetical protein CCHR01_02969 [Colletotrichum chrysophilum]|uniref:Uncharacterized protein n=1 Tax=Colletotrichum chrysophilum TaxID=1836956 RepID=A0AAD9AVW7_9PEZI|nr:hypothetical protein CCHR01_02969 [Colletotrichum chrysophilum]
MYMRRVGTNVPGIIRGAHHAGGKTSRPSATPVRALIEPLSMPRHAQLDPITDNKTEAIPPTPFTPATHTTTTTTTNSSTLDIRKAFTSARAK